MPTVTRMPRMQAFPPIICGSWVIRSSSNMNLSWPLLSVSNSFRAKITRNGRLETDLQGRFSGRILPIDAAVADRWGVLEAEARRRGKPLSTIDALLAATAVQYNLTMVTRNDAHFSSLPATLTLNLGQVAIAAVAGSLNLLVATLSAKPRRSPKLISLVRRSQSLAARLWSKTMSIPVCHCCSPPRPRSS